MKKTHQQLQNFKLWMGGQERTTIGQHAMDGQEMGQALKFYSLGSVHFFSSLFGTLTVVAGWSSGRNC